MSKTIETPVPNFNGTVAGVRFVDGKATTDDESAIAYFERAGYKVAGEVQDERKYPEGDPSDKWTVAQLTAYATENTLDLGEAKSKEQIWNAIRPGGTPYKGVTTLQGVALVNDSTDPKDSTIKNQATLPENVR